MGGFIISYEMIDFVEDKGALKAFGILAGLTGAAFLWIPILQIFGHKLRKISAPVPQVLPSRLPRSPRLPIEKVPESYESAYNESEDAKQPVWTPNVAVRLLARMYYGRRSG